MNSALEILFGRACARRALHHWKDAPEVVLQWLDTGDPELLRAAREAAREAREATWAKWATWEVAREAALSVRAAEWAAAAQREAARATQGEDDDASYAQHWEEVAQQALLRLLHDLALTLPAHGLSALRLEEAHTDPWLTREVWRVLDLPDLNVVEDWYKFPSP